VVGSCFSPTATDTWQEGILYPTIRIISKGQRSPELFRLISANSRFPALLLGDLEAQLGGCQMGHDLVQEIISEHGLPAFRAAVTQMFSDAEANAERAIRALPEGDYTASSFLDNDGVELDKKMVVDVKVTIRDGRMIVDLSGIGDQVAGPVNQSRDGGALAVARLAYKYLLAPLTPVNEGDFSRIDLVIPDGKFLSAGPSAASGSGGYTGNTVVETLMTALAPALPDRVPASHHGIYGIHTITGRNPENGETWFCLDAMSGGWGGWPNADGPGPLRSMVHGDVRDVPVEIQEALYPYRIEVKRLRQDSGGVGRHRGGLGIEKVYSFPVVMPLTLNVNVERTGCPPWGLEGGVAGLIAEAVIVSADGARKSLKKDNVPIKSGDIVLINSGGGGGFGSAIERDPAAVRDDVRLEYVSREAAERRYGVVIDAAGEIDVEATRRARAALAAAVAG
jgi:N-methylhydantoinase B